MRLRGIGMITVATLTEQGRGIFSYSSGLRRIWPRTKHWSFVLWAAVVLVGFEAVRLGRHPVMGFVSGQPTE